MSIMQTTIADIKRLEKRLKRDIDDHKSNLKDLELLNLEIADIQRVIKLVKSPDLKDDLRDMLRERKDDIGYFKDDIKGSREDVEDTKRELADAKADLAEIKALKSKKK